VILALLDLCQKNLIKKKNFVTTERNRERSLIRLLLQKNKINRETYLRLRHPNTYQFLSQKLKRKLVTSLIVLSQDGIELQKLFWLKRDMTKQSTSGAWDAFCPRWSAALTSTKVASIMNRMTDSFSLVHLAFHFHHVTRWLTKSQSSNSNKILQSISFLKMTKWLRFSKLKANKTQQQITVSY